MDIPQLCTQVLMSKKEGIQAWPETLRNPDLAMHQWSLWGSQMNPSPPPKCSCCYISMASKWNDRAVYNYLCCFKGWLWGGFVVSVFHKWQKRKWATSHRVSAAFCSRANCMGIHKFLHEYCTEYRFVANKSRVVCMCIFTQYICTL